MITVCSLKLLYVLSRFSCIRLTLCNPMNCSSPGPYVHGKNTEVGCHAFLQSMFPTQGSNPHLLSPALANQFFSTSTT